MGNYFRKDATWHSLDTLPKKGPVLLCDETQTIHWFAAEPSKEAVTHKEHQRDENTLELMHDKKGPIIKSRKIEPAFWAAIEVVD